MFFFGRVGRVRLSSGGRALLVLVRPLSGVIVVPIVGVRALVANGGPCFEGYLDDRARCQLNSESVSVCQSFTVVVYLRRDFVGRAVAVPFIFVHVSFQGIC